MRKRYLASLAGLLAAASVALGQAPGTPPAVAPAPVTAGAAAPAAVVGSSDELLVGPDGPPDGPLFGAPGVRRTGVVSAEMEYILWFFPRASQSYVFGATNVLGQSGAQVAGVLDSPDRGRSSQPMSGGRLTLGYWLVDDNPWINGGIRDLGVEVNAFVVAQHEDTFHVDTNRTLIRPFFDLNNFQESGFLIAAPGVAAGNLVGQYKANVWGSEVNLWKNLDYDTPGTTYTVKALAGARFLDSDYQLQVGSFSVFNPNIPTTAPFANFAGDRLLINDSITAHNRFYGGQLGLSARYWWTPMWSFEGTAKFALGDTFESLNIAGSQVRSFPNGTTTATNSGLFAQASNSGHFTQNKFAQVPQLDAKVKTVVNNHLTLTLGVSILYWSRIARPGDQIDRDLDITRIPNFLQTGSAPPTGQTRPGVPFTQADLWLVGGTVGAEFRW
jgi:hypothetical protein